MRTIQGDEHNPLLQIASLGLLTPKSNGKKFPPGCRDFFHHSFNLKGPARQFANRDHSHPLDCSHPGFRFQYSGFSGGGNFFLGRGGLVISRPFPDASLDAFLTNDFTRGDQALAIGSSWHPVPHIHSNVNCIAYVHRVSVFTRLSGGPPGGGGVDCLVFSK